MHEGQQIIVNTGGPDILAVIDSRNPYVPALKGCMLARFGPHSAQWMEPQHIRPALLDDLQTINGETFASWQLALWRGLIASGQAPFEASAREALKPYWEAGWSVGSMLGEVAEVRARRA